MGLVLVAMTGCGGATGRTGAEGVRTAWRSGAPVAINGIEVRADEVYVQPWRFYLSALGRDTVAPLLVVRATVTNHGAAPIHIRPGSVACVLPDGQRLPFRSGGLTDDMPRVVLPGLSYTAAFRFFSGTWATSQGAQMDFARAITSGAAPVQVPALAISRVN